MSEQHQYWAFLSYSHQDRRWAQWLHRSLETWPIPRRFVGRPTPAGPAPARFRPIFCDREELPADADLGARIERAIDGSAWLIVVCSMASAKSPWVANEVDRFRQGHGPERVFAVIVGGEPPDCFPAALGAEPIAADLRPEGEGRRLVLLKLAAGMLGVGLDEIIQRDAQRRQRRMTIVTGVSMATALAMSGLTAEAIQSRNEARAQHAQAEGLVEFMLSDLRDTLEPAGRLDALNEVGNRAIAYYASQGTHRLDAASLGRRARVLHLLGSIREQQGDLPGAMKVFQEAAASTRELLARDPDDPDRIYDHAQSVFWVGFVAWRRGSLEEAERQFSEYRRLADRLVAMNPRKPEWQAEVGYANMNLGTVLLAQGQADEAAQAFGRVLALNQALASQEPNDRVHAMDLAQSYGWLADAELARDRTDAAAEDRAAERRIYERLLAAKPSNKEAQLALAVNRTGTGRVLMQEGRTSRALAELTRAAADLEGLVAGEPDNVDYREKAVTALIELGEARLKARSPGAEAAADRALTLAEGLVAKDPTVAKWQGVQLGSARLLKMKVAARAARSPSARREALADAPAEAARLERLLARRPQDLALARVAAEARDLASQQSSAPQRAVFAGNPQAQKDQ
ncbi:MAG: toll/interleukin-1 receptor domain-containing protein [Parcubacteria group bacterium]